MPTGSHQSIILSYPTVSLKDQGHCLQGVFQMGLWKVRSVYIWWSLCMYGCVCESKHIRELKLLSHLVPMGFFQKLNYDCCCSVVQSCLTLCDPMDCSMPGFLVLHHLLELFQTHVYWVGDAIQPSHPLSSPFSPAFNPSQHQGLFQWVSSSPSGGQSIGASASPSILPMNIQDWFPLGLTGLISLQSKGLSRVLFNTTVQKASILQCSDFFMVQFSHPYMTTGKTIALTEWTFVGKVMSLLFNMLSRFFFQEASIFYLWFNYDYHYRN